MAKRDTRSEITVWQSPALQAELLRGRFVDFAYDVHTHETACFALLTKGRIRIRMKGSEFVAAAGDLYAIDADEPHAGWAVDDEGWQLRTLYVDVARLEALAGRESGGGSVSLAGPILRDAALCASLHALHVCSQQRGPALAHDEACLAFAARLLQRHVRSALQPARPGLEAGAVQRARDFLDDHLGDQVSLAHIAQAAGLPAFPLFRAFQRTTGMTPHAYQRQARVRLAMRLIRQGEPLSHIGAQAGFADQAHLTRWFRRFMGITPGQYQGAVSGKTQAVQ